MLPLNSDVVAHILEVLADDYGLLYRCSLVNWEFNHFASKLLYSHVVLSPPFRPVLNLMDPGSIPETSNFTSALIQRNAVHVVELEVSGYISPRPPPRNTISQKIASTIKTFTNLRSVRFIPITHHEELFGPSLPGLPELTNLSELEANSSCTDELHGPNLVKVGNLSKLSLISPGRTILELLPEWLGRLSTTLGELQLKSNCGSITPGVLECLIPHIKDNIHTLTLGLSYSLTNDDVFSFLSQLPNLKDLQLRYYWQLKRPVRQPRLIALRSFTATHSQVYYKKDANELDKWVRRVIGGSPNLECLHMLCDQQDPDQHMDRGAAVAHDALIKHIVARHAETIRVLCLPSAFISVKGLKALLGSCTKLEECHLRTGKSVISIIASSKETLSFLHSVSLQICNVQSKYQVEEALVSNLLRYGPPSLRRLEVNGSQWKAQWMTTTETDNLVEFIVEKDVKNKPPWSRK